MTTRDPYIAEAAERLAKSAYHVAERGGYRLGRYDTNPEVRALADTLKELGWQPPVSPEEHAAAEHAKSRGYGKHHTLYDSVVVNALAVIERYKKLVPTPDVAEICSVLQQAHNAVAELCQGQDPANQCWVTERLVRELLTKLEA